MDKMYKKTQFCKKGYSKVNLCGRIGMYEIAAKYIENQ